MRWLTHGKWKQREYELHVTDYKKYVISIAEYVKISLVSVCITFLIAYLFYDNITVFFVFILPVEFMMINVYGKKMCGKRKKEMQLQFRDMCIAVSAGLTTGESFENAVIDSGKELMQIYGQDCYMLKEISIIKRKLMLSISVEDIFRDLSDRTDIEDISTFADILVIAKRTGGDLIGIIKKAADNISEKLDMEREITSIINSKKYEQMIMNLVPLFIILYMRLTSGSVINAMYDSVIGRVVMTVCLIVYIFALWLGDKVTHVSV